MRHFLRLLSFALPLFELAVAKGIFAQEKAPSFEACEHVVSYANRGELARILIPSESYNSLQIQDPEDLSRSNITFRKVIDINNDGALERVFVVSGGRIGWEHFLVYELATDQVIEVKTSPEDDWESKNLRWAMDNAFIQFEGVTYILGKTNQSLHYLAHMNPQNEKKVICEFAQREQPSRQLKESQDNDVCKLATEDRIDYVEFTKLHSISQKVVKKAGFRETTPSEEAAFIDINNDGKKELIISLKIASGAGPGCDATILAVVTPDRIALDEKLTKKLPGARCDSTRVTPFIIQGKTYLDERQEGSHAEHRQIYMLEGDELKTICEFEVRPENYVLDPMKRIEAAAGGKNPWEYAISHPGRALVEALIRGGRDINEMGGSPLRFALLYKRDDLFELLLKAGADPNRKYDNKSLLREAVWRGTTKSVELLLKHGAKETGEGYGALNEAIGRGSVEMLELLLRYGITVNDEAAVEAVIYNNSSKHEKLKLMIAHGLDFNKSYTRDVVVQGIRQESPGVVTVGPEIKFKKVTKSLLQWAKDAGDPEAERILREAGAKKLEGDWIKELREADYQVIQTYGGLAAGLNETDRLKLREEQRAWIREQDARCDSRYSEESMDGWLQHAAMKEDRARCVLESLKTRSTQLVTRRLPSLSLANETIEGRTQQEWSQEYWRWSRSFPSGLEPYNDTSGTRCVQKQAGPVWFLTGSGISTPVMRQCEVPEGRYIFFPVLASLADTKAADTERCNQMRGFLEKMTTNIADLHVEVNNISIPNFTMWRQKTSCFPLQTQEGLRNAISDGYWLMLKPLPPGIYTIKFSGRFLEDGFSQDVEYNLTVK